jgi:carbonic anhydrase
MTHQYTAVGASVPAPLARVASWLRPISITNQSVIDDVQRISKSPLAPREIPIYGCGYSVESGRLAEVPEKGRPFHTAAP